MILNYKGIDVNFTDEGKGTAVVLLHGFLENLTIWKDFIAPISKRNRVITIDLLGHGKTGCLGYIHSMELMADVVEAVLKHLKIRKSILIGHSMGGYVALAFAEKKPDNVKGLCLLNSTASADSSEKKQNRERGIKAVKKNHKTFIRLAVSNLFTEKNRKKYAAEIKFLMDQCLKTPLQGIIAALEGMKTRKDREVLLHFSPYKKFMIIGKNDPVLNYKTLITQAESATIKTKELDGGHMSFIENKNECINAILDFIDNK